MCGVENWELLALAEIEICMYFCKQKYNTIMCSYNITLEDALVEKIRPSFANDQEFELWLKQQLEALLVKYYIEESERQQRLSCARKAIDAMRQQSEQNGNAEMTLEDINEEIRQSRIERKSRKTVAQ